MRAEVRARLRKGRPGRFEVRPEGTVLGRDSAAAVSIPLEGVSREHARIRWNGQGWWIEDLKSTNGTFVNGERVGREKLQHLDVIGLGRRADVVFVLRSPEAAAPAVRKGIARAALVESDGSIHEVPPGEITLGRSVACNVVVEAEAVSKAHARVERSSDQLVLQDLGSSNGTFVNGTRVRTAVLRDGDTLELARVVAFKVVVEQGDVSGSGAYRAAALGAEGEQRFSRDWKTRYEWDAEDLAAIAAAAAGVRPPELAPPPVQPGPAPAPPAPRKAATPPAPTPAARPPAPAPSPVAPGPKAPAPAPPAPAPPAPAPAAPPPVPAPAPAIPAPAGTPRTEAAAKAPGTGPIRRARFVGGTLGFEVSKPGRYELGRASAAHFRIDHTTVSRRHAAVTLSEDRTVITIEDLGAANGTRRNGREVEGVVALDSGDEVKLGEVSLTVALERS